MHALRTAPHRRQGVRRTRLLATGGAFVTTQVAHLFRLFTHQVAHLSHRFYHIKWRLFSVSSHIKWRISPTVLTSYSVFSVFWLVFWLQVRDATHKPLAGIQVGDVGVFSLTRPISPICQSPFFPYLTLKFVFFVFFCFSPTRTHFSHMSEPILPHISP